MLRIEQARAQVPIAWEGPDVIGDVVYDADKGALVAALDDPAFPASTAIADIAGRMLLFAARSRGRGAVFPCSAARHRGWRKGGGTYYLHGRMGRTRSSAARVGEPSPSVNVKLDGTSQVH